MVTKSDQKSACTHTLLTYTNKTTGRNPRSANVNNSTSEDITPFEIEQSILKSLPPKHRKFAEYLITLGEWIVVPDEEWYP